MENSIEDLRRLEDEFKGCQKVLTAIGDEIRCQLLVIMMQGECSGSRVADIAEKTSLSRPAVSHHMQILKDAGIVKSRKEGTCIYYYLDPQADEVDKLIAMLSHVKAFMKNVPDRSGR